MVAGWSESEQAMIKMWDRLRTILLYCDTEPMELWGSILSFAWAISLIFANELYDRSGFYSVMRSVTSAEVWAAIFASFGLINLIALLNDWSRARWIHSMLSTILWSGLAGLLAIGLWRASSIATLIVVSLAAIWVTRRRYNSEYRRK